MRNTQHYELRPARVALGLTRKQSECLSFIENYIAKNGIPPSFDEMKDALGIRSKSGIHRLVHALKERGHIDFLNHRARSITVLSEVA